jgi:hypothetical protein
LRRFFEAITKRLKQESSLTIIPCILSFTISRTTGKSLQDNINIDDIEEGVAKPVEAVDVHVVQAQPEEMTGVSPPETEKPADVPPPAPTPTADAPTTDVAPPAPTTADVAPPMP